MMLNFYFHLHTRLLHEQQDQGKINYMIEEYQFQQKIQDLWSNLWNHVYKNKIIVIQKYKTSNRHWLF
jgi:hypothetical protein